MVSKHFLTLFLGFLLFSCAQVGNISGGPEDVVAPKPVAKKTSPANGSTNFTGKEVNITFDEYFKLSDPNLNIKLVPAHATIKSSVRKKTLRLRWEEDLLPNTTYAIYINNAVKDITESNDSIIQYVFSTGNSIDSLEYDVSISNAWSGKAIEKMVVGLYDPKTSELLSFAETASDGRAKLRYLKPGIYSVIAFDDENHDLSIQSHEAIAFATGTLRLDSSFIDSVPLRMFTPTGEPEITSKKIVPPGSLVLGSNFPLAGALFYDDGSPVDKSHCQFIEQDSVRLYIHSEDRSSVKLVVHKDTIADTLTFRLSETERKTGVSIKPIISTGMYSPWDSLSFQLNDYITGIDTTKILVLNTVDSTVINPESFLHSFNQFSVQVKNRNALEKINVNFEKGAIKTENGESAAFNCDINFLSAKKFGSIRLNLMHYQEESIILLLMQNGKVVRSMSLRPDSKPVLIEGLSSGQYTFRVIHDVNENEQWDIGSYADRIQPEKIDYFSTATTVRANWEVEATLMPEKTP